MHEKRSKMTKEVAQEERLEKGYLNWSMDGGPKVTVGKQMVTAQDQKKATERLLGRKYWAVDRVSVLRKKEIVTRAVEEILAVCW